MPEIGDLVRELYQSAGDRLGAYGYFLTGSQHEAEELVQAAVVKIFVKRRRLDNVHAAEAYVRATMRTTHIDGLRRRVTLSKITPTIARGERFEDSSANTDSQDVVTQAIQSLSPQVRTVVALRYFDDLTLGQIAEAMGLREGTVKKYLSVGRAALAPVLGVEDPTDPDHILVVEGGVR